MPTLYYRVEAPGVNILKSVSDKVVEGLLEELDLTDSFKDALYIVSSFTANSQYANQDNVPTLIKNRCDVDVNYIMDKSQVPWPIDTPYTTTAYGIRSSAAGHYTPIFQDIDAGILIEHTTTACACEMTFNLTFGTFDEATKAFDTIQSRYKGSLVQIPFDLSFAYPVSFSLLEFLTTVYKAKTGFKDKSFLDYIDQMKRTQISFDIRKTQLLKPDADRELLIRCQQLNSVAQLTMDQKEPDVDRVESLPDTYKISFTFVVQFGRPVVIAVHTPISVDNTLLPNSLFESTIANFHYAPEVGGVYQDLVCNSFARGSYGDYNRAAKIVRLPAYDDWFSADRQYFQYKYQPFLIAHFTLDGPITKFNLNDLDVKLHPIVQAIIKETGNTVFVYGGLFNIGIYADTLRLGPSLVSIDDDLNITIMSNRPDKVYHLVISETTSLFKTDPVWDHLLIKYRYFFPLTIERNIQSLVKNRYFYIAYDNQFLTLIDRLTTRGKLKIVLDVMIGLGEMNKDVYAYTQNPSQLADYLAYTKSAREEYTLPDGSDAVSQTVRDYYSSKASVEGRSLLVAFIEQCLISGYMRLDEVPGQYLDPNPMIYPYYPGQGGFYAFNTPLRVINYTIDPNKRTD